MSAPSDAAAAAATSQSNARALQLALTHLQGALTYTDETNVDTNKKLWNEYAKNYSNKQASAAQNGAATAATTAAVADSSSGASANPSSWVVSMASHVSRDATQLQFLGDEWSDEQSLDQALNEFLMPCIGVDRLAASVWAEAAAESARSGVVSHLPAPATANPLAPSSQLVVAEIGVGGGRIASRVYRHVRHLHCFDIAKEMLKQAQSSIQELHAAEQALATSSASSDAPATTAASSDTPATTTVAPASSSLPSNLSFHLLTSSPQFPSHLHGTCDIVYSFDVLPHVDLHTIFGYFKSIKSLLKPNPAPGDATRPRPRVFLHTANLCAPLGFDRFSKQSRYTAGGFYFLSPDIVRQLAAQTGYRIVQESRCNASADADSAPEFQAARDARQKNIYYQRDFLFVMEVI